MKKSLKISFIIILMLTLLTVFSLHVKADEYKIDAKNFNATYQTDLTDEINLAKSIMGYIRSIAAIALVIIIAYLGIKYMIGSAEERADYKKSFLPLIIGLFIIFMATTIMDIVWNIDKEVEETAVTCSHEYGTSSPYRHGNHYCYKCHKAPQPCYSLDGDDKCDVCGTRLTE